MKKRVLSTLLALCMMLTLMPGGAWASTTELIATGDCGKIANTVSWSLDGEKTLRIYGLGEMADYAGSDVPWYQHRSSIKAVVVEDGVTSIGNYAFALCYSLNNVTLPHSTVDIGNGSFRGCSNLTHIQIPDGVLSIGNYTFEGCYNLISITIPSSVTVIGENAFLGCGNLTDITVDIGNSAFASDNGVLLNKDRTELLRCPGGKCGSYNIPDTVISIAPAAFSSCENITNVTIPNSVVNIGASAFACSGLVGHLTIPNGVISIGNAAFASCFKITDVFIPQSVSDIGEHAFVSCTCLANIEVDPANTSYMTKNGVLFNKSKTNLICYPAGRNGTYIIPDGITELSQGAFYGCSGLTSVVIPEGVTTISGDGCCFGGCYNLESLTLPKSITKIALYDERNLSNVYYGGNEEEWNSLLLLLSFDTKYIFSNATIHYNSTGPGTGTTGGQGGTGENPDPKPDPDLPDIPDWYEDLKITEHKIKFYPWFLGSDPGSSTSIDLGVNWGWGLFNGTSTGYDDRLAIAGLALSAAAESSQASAEAVLNQLGYDDVRSYNYNLPWYQIAQPGVSFGHKKLIISGKEQHYFAIVVRGTTSVADVITDAASLVGGFNLAEVFIDTYLQSFMLDCKVSPTTASENLRFFVTGHSLGGAVANLSAGTLNDRYGCKNVFAYTFAAPNCLILGSPVDNSLNIHNFLHTQDAVPALYTSMVERHGDDVWFYTGNYPDMYKYFPTLTNGKDLRTYLDDWWSSWKISYQVNKLLCAHSVDTYMSYLLARGSASKVKIYTTIIGVFCPVDAELYANTADGELLVARVIDNEIDSSVPPGIAVRVDGDRKYFYLLQDGDYTLRLTGTDQGKMSYSVQEIDLVTGDMADEKSFANVALTAGKEFTSYVSVWNKADSSIDTTNKVDTPEVPLYILNATGTPEKEVLPDGNGTEVPITEPNDPDIPDTPETPDDPTITYTITFNPNGGSVSAAEITTSADGKLSALPTPSRIGYTFMGWFTAPSGGTAVTTDTVFSDNATVYAQWSYNGGGSTGGDNWIPSDNTGSPSNGNSSANSYSITTPSVTGGTITVNPKSATEGSTVTITVTSDTGYTLTSLIVKDNTGKEVELADKGNGKYTFVMPGSKITIDASFQLTQDAESSTEATPWNNPFADVSAGAWYYDAVEFVGSNSLMNGVSTNTFAPDANLSRAMLAQILYNKEGQPATTTNSVFEDVANDAWYADAVAWAATSDIVNGYGNDLFGPEDNITREQLAVMLWRYEKEPAATISELHFSDTGEISGYALDAMRWTVENGIINGKGNGILDPKGLATRAQVAQMLKNYLRK